MTNGRCGASGRGTTERGSTTARGRSPLRRSAATVVAASLVLIGCGGDDDAAESTTTTTEAESERPRFEGPADAEFCELSLYLMLPPGADSPNDLRDFYDRIDEVGDRFVEQAPAEIANEAKRFVEGSSSLRESLEDVRFDASRLDPERAAALSDPEFTRAGSIVAAFNREACGGDVTTEDAPDDAQVEPDAEGGTETESGSDADADGNVPAGEEDQ